MLAFDPSLRRLYVATESGVISVFAETAHGLRKLGEDFLATEAHTIAVDPGHAPRLPAAAGAELHAPLARHAAGLAPNAGAGGRSRS